MEQTPILKNNLIYKDGKLKKWFKRLIVASVSVAILSVGISGIVYAANRENTYLKEIWIVQKQDNDKAYHDKDPLQIELEDETIDDKEYVKAGVMDFTIKYEFNNDVDYWSNGYDYSVNLIVPDNKDSQHEFNVSTHTASFPGFEFRIEWGSCLFDTWKNYYEQLVWGLQIRPLAPGGGSDY